MRVEKKQDLIISEDYNPSLKEGELYISSSNLYSSTGMVRKIKTNNIQNEYETGTYDHCSTDVYINKPILIIAVGKENIYEYILSKYGHSLACRVKILIKIRMRANTNIKEKSFILFSVIGDENLYIEEYSELMGLKRIS